MCKLLRLAKYNCLVCGSNIYADMRPVTETPYVKKFICPFGCPGELKFICKVEAGYRFIK